MTVAQWPVVHPFMIMTVAQWPIVDPFIIMTVAQWPIVDPFMIMTVAQWPVVNPPLHRPCRRDPEGPARNGRTALCTDMGMNVWIDVSIDVWIDICVDMRTAGRTQRLTRELKGDDCMLPHTGMAWYVIARYTALGTQGCWNPFRVTNSDHDFINRPS